MLRVIKGCYCPTDVLELNNEFWPFEETVVFVVSIIIEF